MNEQKRIDINGKRILITGCAGFIGGAVTSGLIENTQAAIIGIDNLNNYYDAALKEYRLNIIRKAAKEQGRFTFIKADISDRKLIDDIFRRYRPQIVIHLAAQAGVRYSIDNPDVYISSNITGFYNIVEACRHSGDNGGTPVEHLLYASSSSVYGNNRKMPYSPGDKTDKPVSLYAATKKSDELIAYSYSALYGIPMTGMRFFTVYGPAGRPDMAYYIFTEKIIRGERIELYNNGNNQRDYTYIDDVVQAVIRLAGYVPECDDNGAEHIIYNIGNNTPVKVTEFSKILADALKQEGLIQEQADISDITEPVPRCPGDVDVTYADVTALEDMTGYRPSTTLSEGLKRFVHWYKEYEVEGNACNSDRSYGAGHNGTSDNSGTRIIVATHILYQMPEGDIYLPVQAGASCSDSIGITPDNTGDNISERNAGYCELTALYWAWKNLAVDNIGIVHYRRLFTMKRIKADRNDVLTAEQAERLLDRYDVILPLKRHYVIETNYSQYIHAHHKEDLDTVRQIIEERHPDYIDAYDRVMKRRNGHRFNMFIMRKDKADMYCAWLFDILFELERRLDVSTYNARDRRVFGLVSERLLDVWLEAGGLSCKDIPYVFLERQNWVIKIASFIMRKIRRGRKDG